jgi:YVTN family beta-propeller protein
VTKNLFRAATVLVLSAIAALSAGAASAAPQAPAAGDVTAKCRHVVYKDGPRDHDPGLAPGGYAFVVNSDDPTGNNGTLAVVDRRTRAVVRTVTGFGQLPNAVGVQCDASRAYVANFYSNSLSVVDTGSGTVFRTVPVGVQPVQVVMSRDGRYAYVVNSGAVNVAGSISVLDTTTNTVARTLSVGFNPVRLALATRGPWAYVVTDNTLRKVNLVTGQTRETLSNPTSGGQWVSLAVTSDGRTAYVVDATTNTVTVVDLRRFSRLLTPIEIDGFGLADNVAVSPDGSKLYVPQEGTSDLSVVDLTTYPVGPVDITTVEVGRNPTAVAFSPDGLEAYVTSSLDDPKGFTVVDASRTQVAAQVNVGSGPFDVAVVDLG